MKILSPSQMRDLEGKADKRGYPSSFLMDKAASAAYRVLHREYSVLTKSILIICGRGNNGGDGLALACLLNHDVEIYLPMGLPPEGSLGFFHLDRCREKGIPIHLEGDLPKGLERKYALIVDALFGTGLNRPVEGALRSLIQTINNNNIPVLSLDIPSGVNGSNGQIEGMAIKADHTILFGLPKGGNLLLPGFEQGGKLHLTRISIPHELRETQQALLRVNRPQALGKRPCNSHKTTWGRLLVIGGSLNYGGAPRFAAQAFLKSGGGYVHMAVPEQLSLPISLTFPEAVLHPLRTDSGFLNGHHGKEIEKLMKGKDILILGPGLGLNDGTGRFVREIVAQAELPLIIDGDGLTHLAGHEKILQGKEVYLTPHPGEAASLLGISTKEGEKDRLKTVRTLADRYGAVVVLKGAHSLITAPGEDIFMNLSGDTSLATAGSGDLLCGILASLLGGGLKGREALGTAVFIHGLAGERAGEEWGEDGVIARDILSSLPLALKDYRLNYQVYQTGIEGKIRIVQ
jgi:ADP-dependent NAD(P)H-hydrate dehydratase / NAD(P)H-hydrate epimerase